MIASFGSNVKHGIIVMATKLERADKDEVTGRLSNIREIMRDLGIVYELVLWQNKRLNDESFNAQVTNLMHSLSRTKIVPTRDLDYLHSQVARKTQELYDKQVPQVKKEIIEVEEQYVEGRTELEEYRHQKIVMENDEESYEKVEEYSEREGE